MEERLARENLIKSQQERSSTNRYTKQVLENWKRIESRGLNKYVTLDYEKLSEIATDHFADNFQIPRWNEEGIYPRDNTAFKAQAIVSSVFNFAYNKPGKTGDKYNASAISKDDIPSPKFPLSGSMSMQRKIYEAFGENPDITSDMLRPFDSKNGIKKLFGEIPLLDERQKVLDDYTRGLDKYYEGSTAKILDDLKTHSRRGNTRLNAFGKKGLVEELISKFPIAFGEDKQSLYGYSMPFYKRAQLVAALIHGREVNDGQNGISDIAKLGAIADYQLPRALKSLGILKYNPELSNLVDNWQIIPKGSSMEGEIRASTVVAIQKMMDEINTKRLQNKLPSINMCHMDFWLWSMGRADKTSLPHLTPTSNY
ncbi:MAG TPA: queuosine salvage family protein [Patescibacteria group bacterium]